MLGEFVYLFNRAIGFYELLIFVYVMFTWFQVSRYHPVARLIYNITEPFVNKFRAVLMFQGGGMDLAPIIAVFVLEMVRNVITRALLGGF